MSKLTTCYSQRSENGAPEFRSAHADGPRAPSLTTSALLLRQLSTAGPRGSEQFKALLA